MPRASKTEHARNQVGTNAADAAAARGGEDMGRSSQGGGPQAARPTFDTARHAPQGRPAIPRAGHHPRNARRAVAALAARLRRAPPRHRPGVRRSLPGDHFSIQQDHGHFVVEGDEARGARGGVHGLAIRLALAVNRVLGRKGTVGGDRYHARPLTTPRQMRASMVYVLLNFRKHLRAPACIDPRSSGPHFSGWHTVPAPTDVAPATVAPGTWMARIEWRLAGGPLRVDEQPAAVRPPANLNQRMLRRVGAPPGP
jgi:hypothetical protein